MNPASAVIAKCGSCSSSSPGGPIPMSPASTGSVGARAAASTIAAPSERPITALPNAAASTMKAGMPIASSRATVFHSRQRRARSTFRPAENSAITTASSVACSSSSASAIGSIPSTPSRASAPAATTPSPR